MRSTGGAGRSRAKSGGGYCFGAWGLSRGPCPSGRNSWLWCAWRRSSNGTTTWSSLDPRGTGKSHLYQQISPYAHLISGGKATVAKMFVNNASGQRGLVCQYDVVCFDEISGVSFDQKDGVNILKGYMESGEFSRGKESIRAEGGVVMVGNLDVEVEHQQKVGHLLSPLSADMRDDTAFMDRIHAYVPGWDFPKLNPNEHFTDHFGLVSDFLSECWSRLRVEQPCSGTARARELWRGAQRTRHHGGQQDGERAPQAPVSRSGNGSPGRRVGDAGSPCARIPTPGQGTAETGCSRASFAILISATRWARTG